MKHIAAAALCLSLTACMEPPVRVDGAISIEQLLDETAGRPFECQGYDPAKDACASTSTYEQVGPNRYFARTQSLFGPRNLTVESSATFRSVGDLFCAAGTDYSIRVLSSDSDFQDELILAEVESFVRSLGEVCLVIRRDGDGYIAEVATGDEAVMDQEPQRLNYFAAPKPLYPSDDQ